MDDKKDVQIRGLSWHTVCALAVKARCMNRTFDEVAAKAIELHMQAVKAQSQQPTDAVNRAVKKIVRQARRK